MGSSTSDLCPSYISCHQGGRGRLFTFMSSLNCMWAGLTPIIPTSLVIVIITPIIDNMHDCMIVKEVIAIFSMHRC